jgi:hypothetical protein
MEEWKYNPVVGFFIDAKLFLNFQWLRELQTEFANWH